MPTPDKEIKFIPAISAFLKTWIAVAVLLSFGGAAWIFEFRDPIKVFTTVAIFTTALVGVWILFWFLFGIFGNFIPSAIFTRKSAASAFVVIYLGFVGLSLFQMPWEGWIMRRTQYDSKLRWQPTILIGSIFAAPKGLMGANPDDGYLIAQETPPRLKSEKILVLWVAGGLLTSGLAFLILTVGKNRAQSAHNELN